MTQAETGREKTLLIVIVALMALVALMFWHVRQAEQYVATADERCFEKVRQFNNRNPTFITNYTFNSSVIIGGGEP